MGVNSPFNSHIKARLTRVGVRGDLEKAHLDSDLSVCHCYLLAIIYPLAIIMITICLLVN